LQYKNKIYFDLEYPSTHGISMLNDFVTLKLTENFGFEPTPSQKECIGRLAEFITSGNPEQVFVLNGYAGTGKTTLIRSMVRTLGFLKLKTVLLAPTGRAAKVISSYTKTGAFTVHKKIYRQKSLASGTDQFVLDKNLHTNTAFIVDEASMIADSPSGNSAFGSGRLLEDLFEYIYSGNNCKLILIGDTAQLPPVFSDFSPALSSEYLEKQFLLQVMESELTDVVRQAQESGILHNATLLRQMIENQDTGYPKFETEAFDDITQLNGTELIDEISSCYDRYGINNTVIISRSNKRANKYNEGVRRSILWKEEEISVGDLLMVVKNHYWGLEDEPELNFVANGDIAEVSRIRRHTELYGHKFVDLTLSFLDYEDVVLDRQAMLDTLYLNTASLDNEAAKKFFYAVSEDYADIKSKQKKYIKVRENEFFNALQIKFAYAVTCHKAQGGQWDAVFVDLGYFTEDMLNAETYRWLYTAITRAKKRVYFVNFKDEFFS